MKQFISIFADNSSASITGELTRGQLNIAIAVIIIFAAAMFVLIRKAAKA